MADPPPTEITPAPPHRCVCGGASAVVETRPTATEGLRRRRKCLRCGIRWTTVEARKWRPVSRLRDVRAGPFTLLVAATADPADLLTALADAIAVAVRAGQIVIKIDSLESPLVGDDAPEPSELP